MRIYLFLTMPGSVAEVRNLSNLRIWLQSFSAGNVLRKNTF